MTDKRNVILLPNVIEDIRNIYLAKDKFDRSLTECLQDDFSPNGRGLLYREDGDKIKIWSEDIYILCVDADEANSLKAIAVKEILPYQYHFIIERGSILYGDWNFITIDEARTLDKKTNGTSESEMDFIKEELKDNRDNVFSKKENMEYKRYVEYWEKHDIAKKYEEEILIEKTKKSVVEYNKIKIDFDKEIVKFYIENTTYPFRADERVAITTTEKWKSNRQLESEHIKFISGLDVGSIYRFDRDNRQLVVKSTNDKIRLITEAKNLDEGFLWVDDRGSKSKLKRESEALKRLFKGETVNRNLKKFIPEIGVLDGLETEPIKEALLSEGFYEFKQKQQEAVKGALSCSDIYLVQGPPGTGKTTVISEIIRYLVNDNKKILLSSQTNLAVDNVLQRIGDSENVRAIRIGREEKFELDSMKYSLDQRVNDLQQSMVQELNERAVHYAEIEKRLNEENFLYESHKYVLDKVKVIANTLSNYNQSKTDLDGLNEEKESISKAIREAENLIEDFEIGNGKNMSLLGNLNEIQDRSKHDINENILSCDLSRHINFTVEEEEDINNYFEIIEELKKVTEYVEAIKEKKGKIKKEILQIAMSMKDCSEKIEELREQENFIALGLKQYLLEDIERYEDNYKNLNMDLKEIEYEVMELQERQKEKHDFALNLRSQALKIKENLEYYININSESWMKAFNTPRITKEQFIQIFNRLQTFKTEFLEFMDNAKLLAELPKYGEYLDKKCQLEDIRKGLDETINLIALKEKYRDKFEEKLLEYSENRLIAEYLRYYDINIETLEVNSELENCKDFIDAYANDTIALELYKETRDIQEEWASKLEFYQESFEDIYINTSNLICATCLGIASSNNNHFLDTEFDYVIIDEAARASSNELLIPMTRGRKIVLVGDHKQISPKLEKSILDRLEHDNVVDVEEINTVYKKSLFGLMYDDASENIKTFLDKQFRMSSDISEVVSKYYYDKQLENGENIFSKSHGLESVLKNSFYWIDTSEDDIFLEREENKSYYNMGDVNVTKAILDWLDRNLKTKKSLGIINPYKSQMNKMIEQIDVEKYENLDIEINTIDAFQGREKNIVIMSMVRNNTDGRIGHIGQDSRMNVALSRAQELLFVIGRKDFMLRNKNSHKIRAIINHLERKNCIIRENYFKG